MVGVLVFIDQDVSEPSLVLGCDLGESPKQIHGLPDQVIEIERLGALELPLIAIPHLDKESIGWILG